MHTMQPGTRFVASYSGGKDSALAIHRALSAGMTLQALLITYNEDRKRSWFHGLEEPVLEAVSQAAGVPVVRIRTTSAAYADSFRAALSQAAQQGAQACVFGDIDIQGHLDWAEKLCAEAGIKPLFPLWHEDRRTLVEEGFSARIASRITVVDTARIDASFAGRLLTPALLDELERRGVDACGENGEYHTFAFDTPFFSHAIPVAFDAAQLCDGYAVVPLHLTEDRQRF